MPETAGVGGSAAPADLPGVASGKPAMRPSARASAAEFDLPSLQQGFELPSPTDNNLPSLGGELPSLGGELPSLGGELPSLGGELPIVGRGSMPSFGSLPPTSGLPTVSSNPPVSAAPAGASPISLPPLELDVPPQASPRRSFGELDLDALGPGPRPPSGGRPAMASRPDESLEADPFGEAELAPPRSLGGPGAAAAAARMSSGPPAALGFAATAAAPVIRQAGGGTAYGEVNLDGPAAELPIDAAAPPAYRSALGSDQDMEFDAVPQEPSKGAAAASGGPAVARASVPVSQRSAAKAAAAGGPRRKRPWRLLAGVVVLVVGGASLAFVPNLGPFGAYFILDQVRAGQYQELVASSAKQARGALASDVAPDAVRAAEQVESARVSSPRVKGLRALAAFVAAERELRFGADSELHARAKVLLDEFEGQGEIADLELARAGRAATDGDLPRARQLLSGALGRAAGDLDALALSGEVELRARDAAAALAVWQTLDQKEPSARSKFGLARARYAAGDVAGAEQAAKAVLAANPDHVGAKILLARIASATQGREPEAIGWLEKANKDPARASADERVLASTQLGDIHLGRSRISKAEAAYTEALKIDPKAARALIGIGEALFRAGRYSEAQARFEAGAQADAEDLNAKVGMAKSKLMLERVEEAHGALKKLREANPKSLLVAFWFGRVLEAIGDRDGAEKIYSASIAGTKADPMLVDTYIALALLQNQQGRAEVAQKTLAQAREKLPASAAIHKALGDVAISQGRFVDAVSDLQKAIELDADDLGARFRLGVAYRRDGKFELAQKSFDLVGAADADYPGLALERGLLYEATGRSEEALRAYEGALAKAPSDLDLMLRVGCGYAAAARSKEAEELLRKVLSSRPTSAETHYCLGRALQNEGSRLADALRLFERAVELDAHRAEYQLYVGWAARESGNLPKATRALDQAIALDQGLADAYWQRGVLRQQSGAVKDAIVDLTRALQLRPSRNEVHAALADAYFDLGREPQALGEWRLAVAAQPDNSTWHFRYGKLLAANHMNDQARVELSRALELLEKSPHGERWLPWEAHLLLARAIGARPESVSHWQEFLRLGPIDSPYRAEAKAALTQLGKSP
ncbi:MAG: tetratricopeptide repeat protein [Polyangiaceae bacterium]